MSESKSESELIASNLADWILRENPDRDTLIYTIMLTFENRFHIKNSDRKIIIGHLQGAKEIIPDNLSVIDWLKIVRPVLNFSGEPPWEPNDEDPCVRLKNLVEQLKKTS